MLAQGINGSGSQELDSWIAVAADGTVTAYTGTCDIGQGLYTAQLQLVAEELGVPLDRVRLIQCDTAIFDATGARLREVPFTAERVMAALAARSRAV